MVGPVGGFVLVHVAAPLEVCGSATVRSRRESPRPPHSAVHRISDPDEIPTDAEVLTTPWE